MTRAEGLRVFRTILKVSSAAQSGQSARRVCREEEALFRRANHRRVAASRGRGPDRRHLPAGRDLQADLYRWKKVYGSLLPSEAREMKQLRDENAKLKRRVADLSLDKVMLQDVVQNKF